MFSNIIHFFFASHSSCQTCVKSRLLSVLCFVATRFMLLYLVSFVCHVTKKKIPLTYTHHEILCVVIRHKQIRRRRRRWGRKWNILELFPLARLSPSLSLFDASMCPCPRENLPLKIRFIIVFIPKKLSAASQSSSFISSLSLCLLNDEKCLPARPKIAKCNIP